VLKLGSNGEITDCDISVASNLLASDTAITGADTEATGQETDLMMTIPDFTSHASSPDSLTLCCYDTISDVDQDGSGDICDNCPHDPNADQEDNYPPSATVVGMPVSVRVTLIMILTRMVLMQLSSKLISAEAEHSTV